MAKYLTIIKAAKLAQTSKQNLFKAVKNHVLKHKVIDGQMYTTTEWLNEYMTQRYNRQRLYYNGKPMFSFIDGEFSVKMTATYLQCTIQIVHYLIRIGKITSFRRGVFHVIPKASIDAMLAAEQEKVA